MHPGQGDFLHALQVQAVDLGKNIGLAATAFVAPGQGYDAIGAAIAAAILNFNESTMTTAQQQRVVGFTQAWFDSPPLPGLVANQLQRLVDQLFLVLIIYYQIDAQVVSDRIRIQTGVTAGNDQSGLGITPLQAADLLA